MYLKDYSGRKYVIIGVFILVAFLFLLRLFYLQIIDNSYKLSADNIVLRNIREYPPRGRVYDRNHKLLIYNEAAYDIMVIPRQVKNLDTQAFCRLIGMDTVTFRTQMKKAKRYSYYKPSVFVKQISKQDMGRIEEKLFLYDGFYSQTRTLRHYTHPIAGHLFGNIGEVNSSEIKNDPFYKSGDYIGKSGIERYYEKFLRGKSGMTVVEVDVHNRVKGSYLDGKYDTLAVPGEDLVLTIDMDLQEYGEKLMQNKKGSVVAIDPKTGEILALISSPAYNPNLLVGRERSKNYNLLLNDSLKPLMNRATMGTYPPGSTFKMVNALVALQEKAITQNTYFSCAGPTASPIKCTHNHVTPLKLDMAIQQSCNAYFWNTFNAILNNPRFGNSHKGYESWYRDVVSFGFGHGFNTDIPYEVDGNVPSPDYYNKLYNGSWNALTVRSLSIGQGEILVTPIQLANLGVVIANSGSFYPPHFLKSLEGSDSLMSVFNQLKRTTIDPGYYDIVQESMLEVFDGDHGTARSCRLDSIRQCGKTGTVQNPHGDDHSLFIAYAPYENPKIAVAVIVENSGFGSTWAAPIASLMIEKYLKGSTKRIEMEKKMFEGSLLGNTGNVKPKPLKAR
ncbi:MAG: penicillin-binding protein 2 [Bacteroidales bacterium]|nr:penicillin-binding protein 2 [Bacteroidales bacterium]